jgi:hypothetical protein
MRGLLEVSERILAQHGAVLERVEPEGLEALLPAELQACLGLPEWSRVGFGADLPSQAVRVSVESDWLERLSGLLDRRGSVLHLTLPASRAGALPRGLDQASLPLQNATLRTGPVTKTIARYACFAFQLTAVSEEKREDLLHFCINLANGLPAQHLLDVIQSHLHEFEECAHPPDSLMEVRVNETAARVLPFYVRQRLTPFLVGMERRLARDLDRLYSYYGRLQEEVVRCLQEKQSRGEPEDSLKRERLKLETIAREYPDKVADLGRKYAIRTELRFLQALTATMPVHRLEVTLLRKKGRRLLHLDWNPLAKRTEALSCENCGQTAGGFWLCEDRLHILCADCQGPCRHCARSFCHLCSPSGCPRCES